jgi:hypothetical protein
MGSVSSLSLVVSGISDLDGAHDDEVMTGVNEDKKDGNDTNSGRKRKKDDFVDEQGINAKKRKGSIEISADVIGGEEQAKVPTAQLPQEVSGQPVDPAQQQKLRQQQSRLEKMKEDVEEEEEVVMEGDGGFVQMQLVHEQNHQRQHRHQQQSTHSVDVNSVVQEGLAAVAAENGERGVGRGLTPPVSPKMIVTQNGYVSVVTEKET